MLKLADLGRVSEMLALVLVTSMSALGAEEKRSSTSPSRLSIFTLPVAFSMVTE
jgi:hypothetical protein